MLAGAGVGVIAVGGQSTATTITNPAAPITQQWRLDADYLVQVRVHGLKATEGALLSTASGVCRGLGEGRTYDETVSYVEDVLAIPAPDAEWLVRVAVQARCPQHQGVSVGLPPGKALVGP